VPPPVLRNRIASGRGATEQPNVTGDGEATLTPLFWAIVVVTGVATGLFGAGLMALLFAVEHAAFGYQVGDFESGVEHSSAARRMLSLAIAGVFGGVSWYLLRRYTRGQKSGVHEAVWSGDGTLSLPREAWAPQ
jgi:hypothetical protein